MINKFYDVNFNIIVLIIYSIINYYLLNDYLTINN